jgi:hypothetical protein
MTERKPKLKIEIQTRRAGPKGKGFANLRRPDQVESIPFEELIAPLPHDKLSPPDKSTSHDKLSPGDKLSPRVNMSSPAEIVTPSRDKSAPDDKMSPDDKLSPGDINTRSWTGVPNDVWKKINRRLTPAEQAIFSYLYRQTRGFHRDEYRTAKSELARACMMSERNVPRITKKLTQKGLIEILGHDLDNPDFTKRGTLYRMLVPGAAVKPHGGGGDNLSSGANLSPHSNKRSKENLKEVSPSANPKNCPDCNGTGFWYPEGVEKGVSKCKHERMGK